MNTKKGYELKSFGDGRSSRALHIPFIRVDRSGFTINKSASEKLNSDYVQILANENTGKVLMLPATAKSEATMRVVGADRESSYGRVCSRAFADFIAQKMDVNLKKETKRVFGEYNDELGGIVFDVK